jgi:hypothetical protein
MRVEVDLRPAGRRDVLSHQRQRSNALQDRTRRDALPAAAGRHRLRRRGAELLRRLHGHHVLPPDVAGDWTLSGDIASSSCAIPSPAFESHLFIEQTGTMVHASGLVASYDGTVSATELILRQAGFPRPVGCPGGFYDAFLNISGGAVEGDGSIAITQRWGLFPPATFPGCEPCSILWSGRMTRSVP